MAGPPDLEALAAEYGRYTVDAYVFVQEGLRYAVQQVVGGAGQPRHLDAGELVDGVLALAAERFGLLADIVLAGWGLYGSRDIGAITFQLIEVGIFGKRPQDRLEDFDGGPVFAGLVEDKVRQRLGRS